MQHPNYRQDLKKQAVNYLLYQTELNNPDISQQKFEKFVYPNPTSQPDELAANPFVYDIHALGLDFHHQLRQFEHTSDCPPNRDPERSYYNAQLLHVNRALNDALKDPEVKQNLDRRVDNYYRAHHVYFKEQAKDQAQEQAQAIDEQIDRIIEVHKRANELRQVNQRPNYDPSSVYYNPQLSDAAIEFIQSGEWPSPQAKGQNKVKVNEQAKHVKAEGPAKPKSKTFNLTGLTTQPESGLIY